MTLGLLNLALVALMSVPESVNQPDEIDRPSTSLYGGLLVGTPSGIDLSWHFAERLQWANAAGWHNSDRGKWLVTSDFLYLFPEAIGKIGRWGNLVLYIGLGGQFEYDFDDSIEFRYGSRALLGMKFVMDDGKYELFSSVASGLFYKPRVRASLDTVFGVRLGLW